MLFILASALLSLGGHAIAQEICTSDTNVFTVKVNLFAGELGYYQFEECGDMVNPTIGMELGETYTFIQADRSNYYHPLGFAYYPDGAHADVDELEPAIKSPNTTDGCDETASCPAPMYFLNGEYLGAYSNIPQVLEPTVDIEDFGLDAYEPLFFHPLPDWVGYGTFEIKLLFDTSDFNQDIFYFCHIHQFMTGRIKLLSNGTAITDEDTPVIDYEYDLPSEFDQECGTFGLSSFQLPNDQCLGRYVCDVPESNAGLTNFSKCIDAMDCHMMASMTTSSSAQSPVALFNHQMIPHHQNAVNMAKALLKTGKVVCDDLTEESDMCVLEQILREIVNNQNFQIQAMRGINEFLGYPSEDDCRVVVSPELNMTANPSEAPVSAPTVAPAAEESASAQPTTMTPTQSPTTGTPTQSPTTGMPTQSPTTGMPTQSPTTGTPTVGSTTDSTGAPSAVPTSASPTSSCYSRSAARVSIATLLLIVCHHLW